MYIKTHSKLNLDVPGLKSVAQVESYREKVYACLEEYCRQTRPNQSGRFAKILLRFPSLRSVGIKCLDSINLIPPIPSLSCLIQALNQAIPTQISQVASSNLYFWSRIYTSEFELVEFLRLKSNFYDWSQNFDF